VCVGCMHALVGLSVQHDASHGAMSKNPSVNAFFAYGADWIGNSRWIWLQQHILWHHAHTNHQELDPDASSAEPMLVFSDYSAYSTKRPPAMPIFRLQNYITHMVLALYGPSIIYNGAALWSLRHSEHIPARVADGPFMRRQRSLAIAFRIFYLLRITVAPWYFGGASLLLAALLVGVTTGVCLTFVFVVSHNFEGSDRDPLKLGAAANGNKSKAGKKAICWYRAQAETSCTYGGAFAMVATGGLNFQIEHHLFPRMSSWYYPRIQEAVRKCCDRHGVKYTYFPSLWANTMSMLRYMRQVGALAVLAHAD
jgi:fatty acid desaturase (delta-4 desaturase)